MKSIGIITIHNTQNNYGGALQCFGLYEYLRTEGYNVEVIDLHRPNNADYIDSIRYMPMRVDISILNRVKGYIKEALGIRNLRNPNWKTSWNPIAEDRFNSFNSAVSMSRPYSFIPDLYDNPPQYDIYIAGSDQLWNPTQPYCLEPYFLTFVKNKMAHKISYGTSIGLSEIRNAEKKLFAKWLRSFNRISVREKQACKILSEIINTNIERVPDPTFLIDKDKWLNLANYPSKEEAYILVFSLGRETCLLQKACELADKYACNVKVIDQNFPNDSIWENKIQIIEDAGPREFIGLIKNAQLILTDSFHCTVFSLITNTNNFYTYISPTGDRGSRIIDLLDIYNLSDHMVNSMNEIPNTIKLNDMCIDYEPVNDIMKQEQAIGRKFLSEALNY